MSASYALTNITVQAILKAVLTNTIDGTLAAQVQLGVTDANPTMVSGNAANQANRIWQNTGRVLVSGSSETINLYDFAGIDIGGGAGNGPLGGALALLEVVGLLIYNEPSSAGTITIGGQGTANAFTSIFGSNTDKLGPFKPGGFCLLFEPDQPAWVVGAASNNLLQIAAAGGNVSYDIYVLGRM